MAAHGDGQHRPAETGGESTDNRNNHHHNKHKHINHKHDHNHSTDHQP